MTIPIEFGEAVVAAGQRPGMAGVHMFTARLAWAAAHLLRADGAGLSLSSDASMRVPLGSSDEDSGAAERLQFTVGEGPCLDAFATQSVIVADGASITRTWPSFGAELRRQTPFRSILALPLPRLGALDIYFVDPTGCARVFPDLARAVTVEVLVGLVDADFVVTEVGGGQFPADSPRRRREQVSIAMGMASVELDLSYADSLAVLRSRAFLDERSLDDLAADLVDGRLDIATLRV